MELYAVQNSDGQFFRSKGYGGYGKSWVEKLESAKIYTKKGQALSRITWWSNNFPKYGIPKLIILSAEIKEVVDQTDRVTKVIDKKKIDLEKRKKWDLEQKRKSLEDNISQAKSALDALRKW